MQPTNLAEAAGQVPGLAWGAPFLGVLASIALFPALAPRFWRRRVGLVAAAWIVALLGPEAASAGVATAAEGAWQAALLYLPFIGLLAALYAAGGGILIRGGPVGSPGGNTAMLAGGVGLGIVMGQAGAALVLINTLLRANAHRTRKVHLALFAIVLVANASGALTPLGNPPLFIGYLQGVPFFWTTWHLLLPWLVLTALLLLIFYLLDRHLAAREPPPPSQRRRLHVRGWGNVGLILLIDAAVLAEGAVPAGMVHLFGEPVEVMRLVAVGVFLAAIAASVAFTPRAVHQRNDFTWEPMWEVAVLFLAIFVTIEPVLEMLRAGLAGPFAPVLRMTMGGDGHPLPLAYFWLSGLLSAFLDNTPTYLVFFRLGGMHPPALGAGQVAALTALSAGAVFFGGLTYIGNAPNMMVRGIAAHRGVRMPGFFAFTALAAMLLLTVFLLLSVLFFT